MKFKTKLLQTTLVASTFLSLSLAASTTASANGLSVAQNAVGQAIDVDGYHGAQCYDYTRWYLEYFGSGNLVGGSNKAGFIGHDFYNQLSSRGFYVYYWPQFNQILPGDVINILPGSNGTDPIYGHTAIVESVWADGGMVTLEQNGEKGMFVTRYMRYYAPGTITSLIRP